MDKRKICVITRNKILFQKIFLDISDEYECICAESASGVRADVFLCDIDTVSPELDSQITLSREKNADIALPFSLGEIKRALEGGGSAHTLTYNEYSRRVSVNGRGVELTEGEFSLFLSLARRRGEWVSRRTLNEEVWGRESDGTLLNVYIHYLREKLEGGGEKIIISSRKSGYKIDGRYFEGGEL